MPFVVCRTGMTLGVLCLVAGLLLSAGCVRPSQTSSRASTTTHAEQDDPLDSTMDVLRKDSDYTTCRNIIPELNSYLARHPDEQPALPSAAEEETLRQRYHLDPAELREVTSGSFTALDGHHLELCYLLQDAVNALRVGALPPLEQVRAGFGWTMRQVRLRERSGEAFPPGFVLRTGWGTAKERAFVFVALLRQLGIDGCMVGIPADAKDIAPPRFWLTGALVGKEIFLFDTRLGLAVPGPKGKGVATLAQMRTDPKLLQAFAVDPKYPYDVTPEQAKHAEVYVAATLDAIAPRMHFLENALAQTDNKIRLSTDPLALLQRFETATKEPAFAGMTVRVWNQPGDGATPFRVLRGFVPEDEGGTDKTRLRERSQIAIVPLSYYPKILVQLGSSPQGPGVRLLDAFSKPFVAFAAETRMPLETWKQWLPGLLPRQQEQQQGESEKTPGIQRGPERVPQFMQNERLPRDLELRGHYDEAVAILVAIQGELRQQRQRGADPDLENEVVKWCDKAIQVYADIFRAQRARSSARTQGLEADAALAQAVLAQKNLWDQSDKLKQFLDAAAAEPMLSEVTYLLALCKHEQAARAQVRLEEGRRGNKAAPADENAARSAWQSAASWWETYLDENGSSANAPTARRRRAEALLHLGEVELATRLLDDLSGDLTGLQKTARLYLAKQARAK
jgi:hypothetical protein